MAKLFVKMHGLGNTFVVLTGPQQLSSNEIVRFCAKETGAGTDGLLLVTPLNQDAVKMEYWNADGSRAEMCGNGLRCVARFAVDNKLVAQNRFFVETDTGPLGVSWDGIDYTKIDVQVGKVAFGRKSVRLYGFDFYIADVGNPHAVTFVKDVESFDVPRVGPQIESAKLFPNRTNVEFAELLGRNRIKLRVWERGVGETLACGTGMVAASTISSMLGDTEFPVAVDVLGGSAKVSVDAAGYAHIVGPAEYSS